MMSNQTVASPRYNIEKRKEYRAHRFSKAQRRRVKVYGLIALVLIAPPIVPLNVLGFGVLLYGLFTSIKTSKGLVYKNMQYARRTRKMRKQGGGEFTILGSKKPPIPARTVGWRVFPRELTLPKRAASQLDSERIEQYKKEAESPDDFTIGTVYSINADCDTAYVVGTGMDSASGDAMADFQGRGEVVQALARVALETQTLPGIAMIHHIRPKNMQLAYEWCNNNLDPEVVRLMFSEEILDITDMATFLAASVEMKQAYAHRLRLINEEMNDVDAIMALAITVPRDTRWKTGPDGTIDGYLTKRQLSNAPIVKLALSLEHEIRQTKVTDGALLSKNDVDRLVRTTWDVTDIAEYHKTEMVRTKFSAAQEYLSELPEGAEMPPSPKKWPTESIRPVWSQESGRLYLNMDGTFQCVMLVTAYGKSSITPDGFAKVFNARGLLAPYTGLTLSLVGDLVNVAREQQDLARMQAWTNARRQSRKAGIVQTPEELEKEQLIEKKRFAYHYGGPLALSYNVYLLVSAATIDLLDMSVDYVEANTRNISMTVGYFDEEARLLDAFITAGFGVSTGDW
jgi:hypothetical protein